MEGSSSLDNPITLITGAVLKNLVPDVKNDGLVTVARAPAPSDAITVPSPYLSWLTRSPTSRLSVTVSSFGQFGS